MAFRALHEILSTKFWDITPDALQTYRHLLEGNIADRIAYVKPEEREDRPFLLSASTDFQEKLYVKNYDRIWDPEDLDDDDKVINVISIYGPVLRNGDACSYGSYEHRELIRRASADKHVIGHIFRINTPGGSSYSKYDYEDAVNIAHSYGLPVIGLIENMACSAGYAAAALCDEVYSDGLHNIVGCVGTMMAGYMQNHGDQNTVTQERYIEMVAEQSPDKNLEYRKLAAGDETMIQTELNRLCKEFQDTVKRHRPQVKDDQITGKTFDSGEVVGTLIDGIGTMQTAISRVQALTKRK